MTIIVGYKFDGKCFMAADRQTTDLSSGEVQYVDTKIIAHENILFGVSGRTETQRVLANELTPDKMVFDRSQYENPYVFIMNNVIPEIERIVSNRKLLRTTTKGTQTLGGSILIAFAGEFYLLHNEFVVSLSCCADNNWICVGSADTFTDGVLYGIAHINGKPGCIHHVEEFISQGIKITAKNNAYVGFSDEHKEITIYRV